MLLLALALAAVVHPPLVEQLPPQLRDAFVTLSKLGRGGGGYAAPGAEGAPAGTGDAADDEKQWPWGPAEEGGEQAEGERDDPPAEQKVNGMDRN